MSSRHGHPLVTYGFASLSLYLGLADGQLSVGADLGLGVNLLPSGCPSVLTVTVLPDDYTGNLVGQPTLPCLPTLVPSGDPLANLPGVVSSLLAVPTGTPTIPLAYFISSVLASLPTGVPVNLQDVIASVLAALPSETAVTNLPGVVSSILGGIPTNLPLTNLPGVISSVLDNVPDIPIATHLPGAVSSIAGALPTGLPVSSVAGDLQSEMPILTQLPGASSSILSGVTGVMTSLPGPVDSVLSELSPAVTGLTGGVDSILSNLPGVVTSVPGAVDSIVSSILGGGLPFPTPTIDIPLTSELPGALSSIIANLPSDVPTTDLPGVISSVLSSLPSNVPITSDLGNGISSALDDLTIGLPISNVGNALSSLIDSIVPTALPTNNPLTNLDPTSDPLTNLIPTNDLLTTLIPGNPLTGLIPPAATPIGTNLISTTNANGLPTLVFITPTVILPGVTVSTPSGLVFPTNLIPTFSTGLGPIISNLNSLTNVVPTNNPLTSLIPGNKGATATSQSTIPTANVFPPVTCPADSGVSYVASNGRAYQINCATDYAGYDLASSTQLDLYSCVNSCGPVAGCIGVTYQFTTSTCYYKSAISSGTASAAFAGAAPVDLSCPRADGAYYVDSTGANYQILCDVTFPSSVSLSQSAALSTREELVQRVEGDTSILGCSNTCSSLAGCIAVTKTGTTCNYISDLGISAAGSTVADSVVLVEKMIPAIDSDGQTVTSTSRPPTPPTSVSSRAVSAAANTPPPTITPSLPISSAIGGAVSSIVSGAASALSSGLGDTGNAISSVGSGAGSAVGCVVGGVGGLLGAGGACVPTTTVAATTSSISRAAIPSSRSMITTVVPVTTIITTTTVTSCSTGYFGSVVCPVVSMTSELVGSRTTIVAAPTASTLSTLTKISSSSTVSRSSSSSATSPTPTCLLTNSPLLGLVCL
ncbi:hypothetical protein DOTSEDRAFT_25475 [Dothistroma septosporum NZE10]|uniref:Apple domain-containing protein n=1 Tax=Dothistroma septosporum (strain NZE10 / CBS 128990) TaxID=675120 RepID=M2WNF7_DOTSN|nr:hypothetical protein DOTSEDRAFT_25475 [Dothistroma septosporum NZE10]